MGLLLIAAVGGWLYRAIRRQAVVDEARPAEAIVVFGAAEYKGTPSPVFKARLDHAWDLEERGLAPLVITTGGHGGEARFTEAGVGRDYLIQRGVAAGKILADPASQTTFQSVRAAARILAARRLRTCIAVSDGFHLYRIKMMFRARGITAAASPVPNSSIEGDPWLRFVYSLREVFSVALLHLGYRG